MAFETERDHPNVSEETSNRAFAEFLPKVKQVAHKEVSEITEEELSALIEESTPINLAPENQTIFSTLVDLRLALFPRGLPPEESADALLKKLRKTVK